MYKVKSSYAQIAIMPISGLTDYAEWETGEEVLVASSQEIFIAAGSDQDPIVNIVISKDANKDSRGKLLLGSCLLSINSELEISAPDGAGIKTDPRVVLPFGDYRVEVFGEKAKQPNFLNICFCKT